MNTLTRFCGIARAAIARNKAKTTLFCLFIAISVFLLTAVVSFMLPLWNNVETKINNHILNRECAVYLEDPDEVQQALESIKKTDHVETAFFQPPQVEAKDTSGALFGNYQLDALHPGYEPVITGGRAPKENEKDTAMIPEKFSDFNDEKKQTIQIDGKMLIGKELYMQDMSGNAHKIKVVGTYSTADPMFSGDQFIVTQKELGSYAGKAGLITPEAQQRYLVVADSYKNLDALMETLRAEYPVHKEESLNFDAAPYNSALMILSIMFAVFVAMILSGACIFVSSCLKSRKKEIALYRALGYKTHHIFQVFTLEYLTEGLICTVIGAALWETAAYLAVNPYLDRLFGRTIMRMKLAFQPAAAIIILIVFAAIVLLACLRAAVKSNKIDPIVLLREE